MSELLIRDLTLPEADLAQEFFHRWWRPNHVFYRHPSLFKWMYHENPSAQKYSNGLTFKVAFWNNELIGVFAYIPFTFNRYGRRSTGVNLSAWWVHPDHRRGSVGLQLLHELQHRMGFEACVSGINTPIAETLYTRMGWVICRCTPRWILVLDALKIRRLLTPADALLPQLERWSQADLVVVPPNLQVKSLDRISALSRFGWDELFWQKIAPNYIGPARELEYLRWRYEDVPVFNYEAAIAFHRGELAGLVVYRFEIVRDAMYSVVRIVDLIAEPWALQSLVRHTVNHARSQGCVMVDCFSTHRMHSDALVQIGFLDAIDAAGEQYWLPHLFQPLDNERRRLNSAWWIRDMDLKHRTAQLDFLLMKGDHEFDRPN